MNGVLGLAEGWWRAGWFPCSLLCLNHFEIYLWTVGKSRHQLILEWLCSVCALLLFVNSLFLLFNFSFQAILSPCLLCYFTFFHPYLFTCPSAPFHQQIWLVCLSYLHVTASTAVVQQGTVITLRSLYYEWARKQKQIEFPRFCSSSVVEQELVLKSLSLVSWVSA